MSQMQQFLFVRHGETVGNLELSTLNFHEHLPEELRASPIRPDKKAKTTVTLPKTVYDLSNERLQNESDCHSCYVLDDH